MPVPADIFAMNKSIANVRELLHMLVNSIICNATSHHVCTESNNDLLLLHIKVLGMLLCYMYKYQNSIREVGKVNK